jgi:hypothetical protein
VLKGKALKRHTLSLFGSADNGVTTSQASAGTRIALLASGNGNSATGYNNWVWLSDD